MRIRSVVAIAILLIAACADSSTDSPPTPTGAIDAGVDASKPTTTKPPPATSDDDDDVVDAGPELPDSAAPEDAGPDAGPPPPPAHYRVFVTKARFNGDLKTAGGGTDGVNGADKICIIAAGVAGIALPGTTTWRAWISTSNVNAGQRIVDRSPWYLVDGSAKVFDDFAGLSSAPFHEIDMNETGGISVQGSSPLSNKVWTATTNAGAFTAGKGCNDFTDGTNANSGGTGSYVAGPGAAGISNWTRYALQANETCEKAWPIYCFEQ